MSTLDPATVHPGSPSDESYPTLVHRRVKEPDAIVAAKTARRRPERPLGADAPVMIIAADHSARGALRAGDRPLAMADRREVLARLCVALSRPGVTGVLGSPDILEDLLLLGELDDKMVFGSMNRGGLSGARWEIDDRYTAYSAASLAESGFDGGKMLLRIDYHDPATARQLEAAGRAVSDLASRGLLAMIEPFISARGDDDTIANDLSPEAVIRSVGIAAGLGTTSAYTWLKLPVLDDMQPVADASTLPILLLGGEIAIDHDATFARWEKALALPSVQGLVVGRALLFPPDDDVAGAVDTAVALLA
jgi:hypothetical protein